MVIQTDSKEYLLELIREKNWEELKLLLEQKDSNELAQLLEELPRDEGPVDIIRMLPYKTANEVIHHLDSEFREYLINNLLESKKFLTLMLNGMNPDNRTALLQELPEDTVQQLIHLLSPGERAIALQLLGYPEDSIGRLMSPDYVAVKPGMSITQALDHIREFGRDSETLNVVYVVDSNWKLIDEIRLREILLAPTHQTISGLMDHRFVSLNALDDQEEAIGIFQEYDRVALPVIDKEGLLLGIVTIDDVMDVASEEATEDFHKFGSMSDAILNPLKAPLAYLYKKRVFWLFTLVFMNLFSGAALASFQNTIQAVVALVFFLPLLTDSGGNAGSQSATLMIRALATGEVILKDWLRLMGREFLVALLLGITMAIGVALVASFRAPEIILVVSLSMVSIVILGSMMGLLLPFIFARFNLDPATASAPLITSLVDILGVIIYFSIATWYLGI